MKTAIRTESYVSEGSSVQLQIDQQFDGKRMRHYASERCSVLHCHHYATLFTQLACDAVNLNGTKVLSDVAAETFAPILAEYFRKHEVSEITDRICLAEQYWSFIGMGNVEFACRPNGAAVTMKHSHIDEGWIKKWGKRDARVNYIGEGFIQAAISAIFGCDWNTVSVQETQSIVSGAKQSRFSVNW